MNRRTLKRTAVAAFALAACVAAHAEFWDGNKLLHNLTGNHSEQMMALGYVIGVADAVRGVHYCPNSPSITAGQVNDLVRLHLERTPSIRHLTADTIVAASLGVVWPCPKSNQRGSGV